MSYTKIKHKCLKCGNTWDDTPNNMLDYPICPKCKGTKGETRISNFLDENNIIHECQKGFDDLKFVKSLFYDFYLPEYNLLIEYDGEFHYRPIFSEKSFNTEKQRDDLKNKYALEHGIDLLRIPYWDFDNIENILENRLLN